MTIEDLTNEDMSVFGHGANVSPTVRALRTKLQAAIDAVNDATLATPAGLSIITTGETRVVGATVPANSLAVGDVVKFSACGVESNTTSASTSELRLRCGPATLSGAILAAWSQVMGTTARTGAPFRIEGEIQIVTLGASGFAAGALSLVLHDATALAAPTGAIQEAIEINTTIANEIELTLASGAASTGWSIFSATMEKRRA